MPDRVHAVHAVHAVFLLLTYRATSPLGRGVEGMWRWGCNGGKGIETP